MRETASAEDGQALVEFALVLPVLLLVVVGILSFARVMNYNEQATHLVNEAARYAAVDQVPAGAPSSLGSWVRAQAVGELSNGSGDVTGTPSVCVIYPQGAAVGNPVQITLTFHWHWVPFLKLGDSTITQTADMRLEVAPTGSFFNQACT